jgi:hypothetical protein
LEHKTRAINNGFLKEGASAEARMNDVKGQHEKCLKEMDTGHARGN